MTGRDWLEDWFAGYFRRPHRYLRTADQLPDLAGDRLEFTWDQYWNLGDTSDPGREDEHEVRVLMYGSREVWLELARGDAREEWSRRIERLLRERYGSRFAGLTRGSYGPHR